MKGGRIETGLDNGIPTSRLAFICESANYPVIRDFPLIAPANRTIKFKVTAYKDFTGGNVKLQIINPASDPLIDSEATPLQEKTIPDIQNEDVQLGIAYKSQQAEPLILRVLSQNSTGNAFIDITGIEKMLQTRNSSYIKK